MTDKMRCQCGWPLVARGMFLACTGPRCIDNPDSSLARVARQAATSAVEADDDDDEDDDGYQE